MERGDTRLRSYYRLVTCVALLTGNCPQRAHSWENRPTLSLCDARSKYSRQLRGCSGAPEPLPPRRYSGRDTGWNFTARLCCKCMLIREACIKYAAGAFGWKLDAGPYLVLICLAFMLFGVLVAQIYYYWLTYKQDKPTLRFYVGAISLMAVLHATFSMIMIYDYYVTFFGDTANGLRRITWSALALTIVQMVFVSLTQALCVSRIWYMSDKSVIVTAIPGALVLCRFALAIACFVFMCMSEFWLDFCSAWRPRLTVNFGFVVSVLTDAATSLILVYYLATNRGTTPTTTNVLNKLMIYVVNTGAITVVFSLGVLLLFNFVRNSLLFAGVYIMLGMLYANTMLAMLNARRTVLTKLHSEHSRSSPIELSTRARAYDGRIHIHTETEVVAVPGNNLARNSIRTSSSPRDSPLDELKAPDTYCYSVQAV